MTSIDEHSVNFGASYKNNPAYTGEGTGDSGRSQRLILPEVGKALVDNMLSKLMLLASGGISWIESGCFSLGGWDEDDQGFTKVVHISGSEVPDDR